VYWVFKSFAFGGREIAGRWKGEEPLGCKCYSSLNPFPLSETTSSLFPKKSKD